MSHCHFYKISISCSAYNTFRCPAHKSGHRLVRVWLLTITDFPLKFLVNEYHILNMGSGSSRVARRQGVMLEYNCKTLHDPWLSNNTEGSDLAPYYGWSGPCLGHFTGIVNTPDHQLLMSARSVRGNIMKIAAQGSLPGDMSKCPTLYLSLFLLCTDSPVGYVVHSWYHQPFLDDLVWYGELCNNWGVVDYISRTCFLSMYGHGLSQ